MLKTGDPTQKAILHPSLVEYCSDERIVRLYQNIEDIYRNAKLPAHGMDHIRRVLINGAEIGNSMICRMDIIIPAILLHDIGFLVNPDPADHHIRGAEMCRQWIQEWNPDDREAIALCIFNHKGETHGFDTFPGSLEEKVVCDADSLEKVGYIGLLQGLRTFSEFGEGTQPEFRSLEKILNHLTVLEDQIFYTERGQALAEQRGGFALRKELYTSALKELQPYSFSS